ncbi:hypothetical protein E2C01_038072 [Portunus trituberculatus]|uniref:Uncharacterized protein n=1 Tax=Portunus trituberculatus TaxID=210409 RepID=A0A5B7FGM3_PORTR|nr:hypothetical protein [Portunus trituberculatus]
MPWNGVFRAHQLTCRDGRWHYLPPLLPSPPLSRPLNPPTTTATALKAPPPPSAPFSPTSLAHPLLPTPCSPPSSANSIVITVKLARYKSEGDRSCPPHVHHLPVCEGRLLKSLRRLVEG